MREICESYTGLTPEMLCEMTLDQIYVLAIRKELLKADAVTPLSVKEAAARGLLPQRSGTKSLCARLQEEAHAKREKERSSKRAQAREARTGDRG